MATTISPRASRAIVTVGALLAVTLVIPAATRGTHATRAALDDPTIVAIFDAANTWDIETGNLAASRAQAADVKQFARMLVHDHTAVRKQGRDLAAKLHVTPTPPTDFPLAKDHATAMVHLRALRGAAFDTAFLRHEVTFHKAVIDAMTNTLLPATKNAQLRDLETKVAPAFQAHMMRAQQLLDEHSHAAASGMSAKD